MRMGVVQEHRSLSLRKDVRVVSRRLMGHFQQEVWSGLIRLEQIAVLFLWALVAFQLVYLVYLVGMCVCMVRIL